VSRLARRLTAQLLAGRRARDPLSVVQRLLAVQGQDPRGARLAVRARSVGVGADDINRALSEERSLLITWLNRGTLHVVASEDYFWLSMLTAPALRTPSQTRLRRSGVSPAEAERAIALIERELCANGPMTGPALRETLRANAIGVDGQAFIHIMFEAGLRGIVVRGPMIGRQHAYALVADWLPRPNPRELDRDRALAELARRYLEGHGPASDGDLARWTGIPLGQARAGLAAIAGELVQRRDGLVDLRERGRAARLPAPRLLGPFEPLLLGWASRVDVLGDAEARVVSGGIFRGFALVGGRAVGGWRIAGDEVVIEPYTNIADADAQALRRDGRAVLEFLGDTGFSRRSP
jgi:hypothetical protein